MTYKEAINRIFEGNCLLILGSGFSCGCETCNGGKMPRADELCSLLDHHSGEESGGDLGLSAENFIDVKGRTALCDLLRNLFTPVDFAEHHMIVAGEEWRRVYTTNYDEIIENATLRARRKRIEGVSLSDNPLDYSNKKNLVVHLNGSLSNLRPDTLNDEFKLTKASYLIDNFKKSRWVNLFEVDVRDADAVFIVGLSLDYDLDIARMVFREQDKDKIFLVVWDGEKNWNVKKLQKFGTVLKNGREQFAKDIKDAKESYLPPAVPEAMRFSSFRCLELKMERPEIKDETIRRLLFWGDVDDAAVQFSISEPENYNYYIYRDRIDSVLNLIDDGEENILIHSSVGNGKTMFIKGLSVRLLQSGYQVFLFHEETDSTVREIEAICSIPDRRKVIIIEDYSKYRSIIDNIVTFRSDTVVIVSDRTASNDLHYDWLNEKFGSEFHEISLNKLTDDEIRSIITLLDSVNLWGELAADKYYKKEEYLTRKCKKELRSLLLNIFNTKTVRDHLNNIFKDLKGDALKTTVLLMMSNYSSFKLDLYDLEKVLNTELITSSSFQRNSVVKEFLDFSTGECKVTSAILGEFILKHFVKPSDLFMIMCEAFKSFDSNNYRYRNALKSLSNHSTLLSLVGHHSEEAKKMIPEYYDAIKNCHWCRNNPHFWLQYAIAMLEKEQYPEAALYFENAYAYAKDKENFNRIQIDNHYARFLLENAVVNQDDEYWNSFTRAHEILTDSRYLKDKKYYPYKVGVLYEPFYRKYRDGMGDAKRVEFKRRAQTLLEMLEKYLKTAPSSRRDVEEARKGLEAIISEKITIKI